MAISCSANAGKAFGPALGESCPGQFDFTLLFEQAVLSLIPGIASLVLLPLRIFRLSRTGGTTDRSPWRVTKLVTGVLLILQQLCLLILWVDAHSAGTWASVPATAINLLVVIQLTALSWLEDARSVRPSSLISVCLLLTLLLDLPQARSLWLQLGPTNFVLPAIFLSTLVTKLGLLLLEARGKRPYLKAAYRRLPPESTSGILNRSVLWWLNSLFRQGYRTIIPFDDLYVLDEALTSARLSTGIGRAWATRQRPERRFEFPLAVISALWCPLAAAVFPRLCLIGFTFAQPFLISRTLGLLSQPNDSLSTDEGYGLVGAAGLIYLGLAFSTLHYNQILYRFVTMFRGAAVALIYDHALRVRDGLYEDSAAVTLMSTDVDRIAACFVDLNECWASLIEVGVGVYLLARELGWVCMMPLAVVAVSSLLVARIAKGIGAKQKTWVDAVQSRIGLTSSVLTGMRGVKMLGLSGVLTSMIQEQRAYETDRMAGFRWNIVWMNVFHNMPWALAPALTFAVYAVQVAVRGSGSIGTTQAFTSLSVITLVTGPTARLLSAIPMTAASVGCFDRVQKFLVTPQRGEPHVVAPVERVQLRDYKGSKSSSGDVELMTMARGAGSDALTQGTAVSMDGVDIRPFEKADFILRDISLSIPTGSLTMIIGPVASGKSTLLRAILAEASCERGSVKVSSPRIAYCAQTPWLPNTTIKEAICGSGSSEALDEEWYRTTIRTCALDHDLSLLADGDQTNIGSGSTTLSGGQKHRVALARAVYSRLGIVLLDDVLSALDSSTKRIAAKRLFGEDGVLRRLRSTALLVTHDRELLPYADKILVLANGKIEHDGSYDELVTSGVIDEAVSLIRETAVKDGVIETGASGLGGKAEEVTATPDDLSRATGDFAVYSYYLKSIGYQKAVVFVFFVVLYVFCATFSQIWLMWWTDIGGGQISLYIIVYFLLAVFNSVGNWGYVWAILIRISPSTGRKFHYILLKTVMGAPQSFYSNTPVGAILNRFSQDMTLIESQLAIGVLVTVSNLVLSLAGAALIATGSTYMAATIPLLVVTVFLLQHVYLRTSRQLRLLDLEARSPLFSHFLESLAGLATVRALGWEEASRDENHRLLDLSQRPYYLLYCVQRWLNLVLDLIVAAEAVTVVGLAVGLRGSASAGLLGVSLNNVLSFNQSLSSLVSGWTQLETSLGSIARLRNFETEVQPEDRGVENVQPPDIWPSRGAIEFNHVYASHSSSTLGLRDVSLKIEAGQKVGICGRTGSGKSSLLATILRLLDLTSGTITIDGTDLAATPRATIRDRITTVPQDPFLLAGISVRLNADPHGANSDGAIVAALERVGLWTGVLQDGAGLDADMAPEMLSAGQKQLFSLARAVLMSRRGRKMARDAVHVKVGGIVLLDEATSDVDVETEQVMQDVVRDEFGAFTVLTVAHRVSAIMSSDVVVVMEAGKIVEVGKPEELLDRGDGWLRQLVMG